MYFSARLFSVKDNEVLHLEGHLYTEEGESLWDEVEDYENQLKEHLKGFKYINNAKPKDENRYCSWTTADQQTEFN